MEEQYPYLVVSLLSDDGTKIGFNTPTQAVSFTILSRYNLIDILFNGLDILYKQSPFKITVSNLLGNLLSSENNRLQFCSALLPPHFLQPLCVCSQNVQTLRSFLFMCTRVCEGIECFELDSKGNHFPLQPIESTRYIENDQQLVKDVTDAFLTKLLDLRICQENDEDPTEIVESIQLIWKNVCLLWNLDDCPGINKLSDRWKNIKFWERSTRKKQVRNDAKLVLATRLCLEQGKIRKKSNHSSSSSHTNMQTKEYLQLLEPMQIWSILVLAEYFKCLLITHAITCYIHQLICTKECHYESPPSRVGSLTLPEQLTITSLIRNNKDSTSVAKRLLIHCHKYQISRKIPNQFTLDIESDSDLSQSEGNDNDATLDSLLESRLTLVDNSKLTTPTTTTPRTPRRASTATSPTAAISSSNQSRVELNNESRVSNTSLSISGVRSPSKVLPYEDYPFRPHGFQATPSDYEPSFTPTTTPTSSSISTSTPVNSSNKRQKIRSSSSEKNKESNQFNWTPEQQHKEIPTRSTRGRDRSLHDKFISPKNENRNSVESDHQTPVVAFGRSVNDSQFKQSSLSRSHSPKNYLLSSSTLRSHDQDSPHTSLSPSSARKRSQERIRLKKQQEMEIKMKEDQEIALRKDQLKSLELKAEIARLHHQPTNQLRRSQSVPNTPVNNRRNQRDNTHSSRSSEKMETKVRGETEISPEEARYRALIRLKEHREKIKRENLEQAKIRSQQNQQKWHERDKKIREFIARQESDNSSNYSPNMRQPPPPPSLSSASSPSSPSGFRINWDAADHPRENQNKQKPARNHLEETLDEIHELSALIDHTLGITATPSPRKTNTHQQQHQQQGQQRKEQQQLPPPPSPPPPMITFYSPTKLSDMLCIKVISLHSLPANIPKTHRLYLSFDWERLGKASTHALPQTKLPNFNATLRFHSPLPHGSSLQDALMNSPPLVIQLYSRGEGSREGEGGVGVGRGVGRGGEREKGEREESQQPEVCLGMKIIKDLSLLDLRRQPIQIQIEKDHKKVVGIIEIEIVIM